MNLKDIEIEINRFLEDAKDKAFFDSKGNKIIHRISVGAQAANHPFFTRLSEHIKGHLNPSDFDKEFQSYITPLEDIYANCLYYQGKGCKQCVKRCPVGSVNSEKRIIEKCFDREFVENKEVSLKIYGKEITACGLCMSGVPCSFTNPMKMLYQQ